MPTPPKRSRSESAKSLIGALLVFFFIRLFIVEAYRIPTGSMIPTLLVGDWLFVNKLAYGPALPFSNTHSGLPVNGPWSWVNTLTMRNG